jgi:4-hydroxy-2-oxoheptanedioate aldolase
MPHVDRRDQAELIKQFTMYPPEGHRGYLSRGPHTGFRRLEEPTWLHEANRECSIVMMVESQLSIQNLDAILDVGIIDTVVVGPGDLSVSFGKPGQFACPEVLEAAHHVIATCKRRGVASGIAVGTAEDAAKWARAGAQFLIVSTDLYFLLDAMTAMVRGIRDRIPDLVARGDALGHQS